MISGRAHFGRSVPAAQFTHRNPRSSKSAPSGCPGGWPIVTEIVFECAGTLVVLYGLSEVFRDIFHPTRSGTLSETAGRLISAALRHTRFRPAVGPIALVTVILCWDALLVGGFALIYCGFPPDGVIGPPGAMAHALGQKYLESLYISLGAFDTFQTFNLWSQVDWLRLVIAVEGLIGISMITASVSWLVLLYPAYARSRQFGRRVSSLLEAERRGAENLVQQFGAILLLQLAEGVLQFRLDVILFPILLHFYPTDESATVSHVLPDLVRLASEAQTSSHGDCKLAGIQLQVALEALAQMLAGRLGRKPDNMLAVFKAFQQTEQ